MDAHHLYGGLSASFFFPPLFGVWCSDGMEWLTSAALPECLRGFACVWVRWGDVSNGDFGGWMFGI